MGALSRKAGYAVGRNHSPFMADADARGGHTILASPATHRLTYFIYCVLVMQ